MVGGGIGAYTSYKENGEISVGGTILYGIAGLAIGATAGFTIEAITAVQAASYMAGIGSALSIDGDPTNEVRMLSDMLVDNPGIQWLSSKWPHLGERMLERGISTNIINETLNKGWVIQQSSDKFMFITTKATVVATRTGYVITTWAYSDNTQNIIDFIKEMVGR